jgi:hypothetical protein
MNHNLRTRSWCAKIDGMTYAEREEAEQKLCRRCWLRPYVRDRPKRCRECFNEVAALYRKPYSQLSTEERRKSIARSYAHVYRKRGKLIKLPCENCGSSDSEGHHPDYSRPLLIVWLCRDCHMAHHDEVKPPKPPPPPEQPRLPRLRVRRRGMTGRERYEAVIAGTWPPRPSEAQAAG